MPEESKKLAVGDGLPDVQLPSGAGRKPIELRRRGRRATVLVAIHGAGCATCRVYVGELGARAGELKEWDGRVVMLATEEPDFDPPDEFELAILPRSEIRARIGIDTPALVIADQWGEIFAVESGEDHEGLLKPAEILEWLRFLAIQCPECQGEAY